MRGLSLAVMGFQNVLWRCGEAQHLCINWLCRAFKERSLPLTSSLLTRYSNIQLRTAQLSWDHLYPKRKKWKRRKRTSGKNARNLREKMWVTAVLRWYLEHVEKVVSAVGPEQDDRGFEPWSNPRPAGTLLCCLCVSCGFPVSLKTCEDYKLSAV